MGSRARAALLLVTAVLSACSAANGGEPDGGPDAFAPADAGRPDSANCPIDVQEVETRCDGIDEDCNGVIDDVPNPPPWYADVDGDGYGDQATEVARCDPPADYVARAGDCADDDPLVFPDAVERCDGLDNDCDPSTPETCPAGCVAVERANFSTRYLFCNVGTSWNEARSLCDNEAFTLARIDDVIENDWIHAKATELATYAAGAGGSIYLGGTDQDAEGVWRWRDGAQFWQGSANGVAVGSLYTAWRSGEPNNDGGENCLTMYPDGTWNDGKCNVLLGFVCERD
jgi:hypothetical protein